MAAQTVEYDIAPPDGWTLVATNPNSIVIRAHDPVDYGVYVGAAAPGPDVRGLPMRAGDAFSASSIAGSVYVRTHEATDRANGRALFVVVSS